MYHPDNKETGDAAKFRKVQDEYKNGACSGVAGYNSSEHEVYKLLLAEKKREMMYYGVEMSMQGIPLDSPETDDGRGLVNIYNLYKRDYAEALNRLTDYEARYC